MRKNKYYFNDETNTYVPLKKNKRVTKLILSVIFITLFFSALGVFFGYHYLIKPKNLGRAQLALQLEKVEMQYTLLNKKFKQTQEVLEDLEERDENIYRSFFELAPISKDIRKAGFGGVNRYEKFTDLPFGELIVKTSENLDILNKRLVIQSTSLDEVLSSAVSKEKMFRHIPAMQPIANKDLTRLASGYGMRLHPILKVGRMHWGTDFSAPKGTPIYATGNAIVKLAGVKGGYGNTVILDHGYGYETLYAHMSRFVVKNGKSVKRGDIIGYVGNSGLSSGPHLHYEVHKNGEKINPISFFNQDISPDEFNELYEKSEKMTVSLD